MQCDCLPESRTLGSYPVDQDIFAARLNDSAIYFTRFPSSPGQETLKEWKVELSFQYEARAVYIQDNLLAVVEQGNECVFTGFPIASGGQSDPL
jgi:hypothetical protein